MASPAAELTGAGVAGQMVKQQLSGVQMHVEVSQLSGLGSGQLKQQGLASQHERSPGEQKQLGGPRQRGSQTLGSEQSVQPGSLTLNISLNPAGQRPLDAGPACAGAASASRRTVAIAIFRVIISPPGCRSRYLTKSMSRQVDDRGRRRLDHLIGPGTLVVIRQRRFS